MWVPGGGSDWELQQVHKAPGSTSSTTKSKGTYRSLDLGIPFPSVKQMDVLAEHVKSDHTQTLDCLAISDDCMTPISQAK